jgi:hypothetical protein
MKRPMSPFIHWSWEWQQALGAMLSVKTETAHQF